MFIGHSSSLGEMSVQGPFCPFLNFCCSDTLLKAAPGAASAERGEGGRERRRERSKRRETGAARGRKARVCLVE